MGLSLSLRSRHVRFSLSLVLVLFAVPPVQAGGNRWTSIGPYGGGVTALEFSANGRTALAGTRKSGVFRSADNGRTWTAASSGLSGDVVDLAASPAAPGRVYAATSSGVFRSDDAGLHWTAANTDLPAGVGAVLVATEPTEPAAVWVAFPTQRALYRSTNLGARWRYAGWGLKGVVRDVAAHPKTAGVVFAATDRGLFRSADSGGHWSPAGLRGHEVSKVVFDRVQPRHLYAITVRVDGQNNTISTVFVSDDGGASWKMGSEQIFTFGSFGNFELVADSAHAGTAWLSAETGSHSVFRTTDGGQHWQSVLEVGRSNLLALAANPLRPGTVLVGHRYYGPFTPAEPAVFRTDDGGTSWSPSDTGIAAQTVFKVLPDPSQPGALFAQGCCSLWKRTGAGRPFTPFFPMLFEPDGDPLDFGDLAFDPKTPSTLYLLADQVIHAYLYKSVDAGATWQQVSDVYEISINSITIDPAHPSTLYGVEVLGKRIYRSDDGGSSWNALSGSEGFYTAQVTVTGTGVYAYGDEQGPPYRNGLRRSTDGGTTWTTLLELTLHFARVSALAEDPRDPQRLWTAFVQTEPDAGGVYRSTDGGAHWSLSRVAGNRPVWALAVDPRNSNRVWAAASAGAVFLSEDGGATWVSFSEGLPSLDVMDLSLDPFDPDTLYASTDGGSVYEFTRRAGGVRE